MPPDPPPALLKVHKKVLGLFATYEHLSKRLSSIPAVEGGSQSIVQAAVARSAAVFLAKEMAKVQVSENSSHFGSLSEVTSLP